MDYSQAFWPKLRSFFEAFLLHAGRCYEAEFCTILLLLRYAFAWYPFFAEVKILSFGRKPWTIVRRIEVVFLRPFYSSLEGAMKLNFAPFYSS